jgi:C4-dicarboxylate transporter
MSLAIALASGTGLVVAALLAPVYQTQGVSPGAVTSGPAALVGVNGWGALLVTACAAHGGRPPG